MINNLNEFVRNESLEIRKFGEQFYLTCSSACFEVNEVGAAIVNVIGKDLTLLELCEKISRKYDFDSIETIKDDVLSFINFLEENNLVSYEK